MEKQELQKLSGRYSKAFWILLLSVYFIGRGKEMIIKTGGTTEGIASFLVFLNALVVFSMFFCIIMWARTKHKMKQTDDKK